MIPTLCAHRTSISFAPSRLPAGRPSTRFYDFAPDLAVEVISPSETAEEVQEKVRDYLAAGSSLVVLVYPRTRLLIAHATDGSSRTYREDEVFSDAAVLPGSPATLQSYSPKS